MRRTWWLSVFLIWWSVAGYAQVDLNELLQTNTVMHAELLRLAFHNANANWSVRTKLLAFRTATHLMSINFLINKSLDHGQKRKEWVDAAIELNKKMAEKSHEYAFKGYGGVDYWSDRTKLFAINLAIHFSSMTTVLDKVMADKIKPKIEKLLSDAQTIAFGGVGDTDYWSRSCKVLSSHAIQALGEINTLLAECR